MSGDCCHCRGLAINQLPNYHQIQSNLNLVKNLIKFYSSEIIVTGTENIKYLNPSLNKDENNFGKSKTPFWCDVAYVETDQPNGKSVCYHVIFLRLLLAILV